VHYLVRGSTPSVSIVLATHNRRDWLRLAIDSVLEQDYDDLELLVMDDGSTDGTPDLLREYQQRHPPDRFRFSRHENMGQGRTLNRGYQLARGEVLGYLSDDDLLAPGAVTRLVRELADLDVVAAYPGYHVIDDEGQVRDTIRPIEYSPLEAFRLIETVIGPGCLVRRPVLEATGGWDLNFHFMADFILWMRVGLAGRVVRVSEPLASWRRHSASITLQAGVEHGRELLRLVDVGARVLGLSPDQTAIRAEALRNACIQAAFHGDTDALSKDDALATIDLTRPATSAFTGGIERDEMPDERVDQVAELWRELAQLTRRLAEVRTYGLGLKAPLRRLGRIGTRKGLKAALRRLDRLGLLDGEGEANPTAWDGDALPLELIEAAVECEADTDPARSRYLVLDLHRQKIPEEEFHELNWMGHRATTDQLSDAVADRRRKLEAAGVRPGTADL
jgi:glycosyltransferase involved in cell wall biosynthesis